MFQTPVVINPDDLPMFCEDYDSGRIRSEEKDREEDLIWKALSQFARLKGDE